MNTISFTRTLSKPKPGPSEVECEFSKEMVPVIIPVLEQAYEIQLLQGTRETLPGGMVRLTFTLDDENAANLRDALRIAYAESTGHYTPN